MQSAFPTSCNIRPRNPGQPAESAKTVHCIWCTTIKLTFRDQPPLSRPMAQPVYVRTRKTVWCKFKYSAFPSPCSAEVNFKKSTSRLTNQSTWITMSHEYNNYVQLRARDTYIPFGHKLLQIYNDFVWTVSRLNRDMNNSLEAVRLPIRKLGPHNSRGPVGTLK